MKRALKSTAALIALLMAISGCNSSGKVVNENVISQGEKAKLEDNVANADNIPITEVKETFCAIRSVKWIKGN